MKKALLFSTAVAVLFCLSGLPLMAQGRGGGGMGGGAGMGQSGGMGQAGGMGQSGGIGMGRGPMDNTGINRGRVGRDNQTMRPQKTPSQLLQDNTKLSSKLQDLLPAGTNIQQAADGFKNLGEFVAAVHVSHNLNIPFDELKGKMTSGDSLGKAIQTLDPNLNHKQVKTEVKKGKQQAKEDIKASHHA